MQVTKRVHKKPDEQFQRLPTEQEFYNSIVTKQDNPRDKALCSLTYITGSRISEVLMTRTKDIYKDDNGITRITLTVLKKRHKRTRTIPIPKGNYLQLITDYSQTLTANDKLFKIGYKRAYQIFTKMKWEGIPINPHLPRHIRNCHLKEILGLNDKQRMKYFDWTSPQYSYDFAIKQDMENKILGTTPSAVPASPVEPQTPQPSFPMELPALTQQQAAQEVLQPFQELFGQVLNPPASATSYSPPHPSASQNVVDSSNETQTINKTTQEPQSEQQCKPESKTNPETQVDTQSNNTPTPQNNSITDAIRQFLQNQ